MISKFAGLMTDLPPHQLSIDALNTSTPNVADLPPFQLRRDALIPPHIWQMDPPIEHTSVVMYGRCYVCVNLRCLGVGCCIGALQYTMLVFGFPFFRC